MARNFIDPYVREADGVADEESEIFDDDTDGDTLIDLLDYGLCPHGAADDEDCYEDGCPGGPAGWELPNAPFAGWI